MKQRVAGLIAVILMAVLLLGGLAIKKQPEPAPRVAPLAAQGVPSSMPPPAGGPENQGKISGAVAALKQDVSAPLRSIPPLETKKEIQDTGPAMVRVLPGRAAMQNTHAPVQMDGALQTAPVAANAPAPIANFNGVSNRNGVLPPDTNGDVGPNHYVQWVNSSFAIYNKTGALLYGPADGNTFILSTADHPECIPLRHNPHPCDAPDPAGNPSGYSTLLWHKHGTIKQPPEQLEIIDHRHPVASGMFGVIKRQIHLCD